MDDDNNITRKTQRKRRKHKLKEERKERKAIKKQQQQQQQNFKLRIFYSSFAIFILVSFALSMLMYTHRETDTRRTSIIIFQ